MTHALEWFGYKLHLLVDAKHELALAYRVTDTQAGHGETLPGVLAQAQANVPADRIETLAYDKAGTVYCYDRVNQPRVRHRMAYIGYEPDREAIKYRCPAKHEGWSCPMADICNAGKSYGKTVRVPREADLRRFPALPRAPRFEGTLGKMRLSPIAQALGAPAAARPTSAAVPEPDLRGRPTASVAG